MSIGVISSVKHDVGRDEVTIAIHGKVYIYDVDGTTRNKIDRLHKRAGKKALDIAEAECYFFKRANGLWKAGPWARTLEDPTPPNPLEATPDPPKSNPQPVQVRMFEEKS